VKDALTGLLNTAAFRLLVEHELVVARRYQRIDAFLVIDVENLRAISAVFGFEGSNDTLRAVAKLLQRTARESDLVGRIGDDEFAILALDCVGEPLGRRISAAVSRAVIQGPGTLRRPLAVRVRIGITEVHPDEEFDELMTRAGHAAFLRSKEH
jgi:diguanylate cyclase (GGDEF)-like protein